MATAWSEGTDAGPGDRAIDSAASAGFTENLGQFSDGNVLLYQRLSDGGIAFERGGVVMTLMEPVESLGHRDLLAPGSDARELKARMASLADREVKGHGVRLTFEGASDVVPQGRQAVDGSSNFFLGDSGGWRTGALTYSQVVYEDLWEGIDLVYMSTDSGVKYEFRVAPGADESKVRVRVEGHDGLSIVDGDLVVSTSVDDIVDSGLVAFHGDDPKADLPASFRLLDGDTYAFDVVGRDPARALVIDPWVFSSYLGGTVDEYVMDMEVDGDGDIYITGYTDSDDFPVTAGAYQRAMTGWMVSYVAKMSSDGSTREFVTYLGGDLFDIANDLDLDSSENVYVCGETYSSNFPVTAGAYQSSHNDGGGIMNFSADGFVTKLDSSGGRLLFSTYVGTDEDDFFTCLDMDSSGRVYLAGIVTGMNLTTSTDAYQSSKGDNDTWYYDIQVRALDSTGARMLYTTYLGAEDDDMPMDIEMTASGQVCVAGGTYSKGFVNTTGAYQRTNKGWWTYSGFITKLKSDLTDVTYSTFLGGSEDDVIMEILFDGGGNMTVGGTTSSFDFPVSSDAYKRRMSGNNGTDAFVTILAANGSALLHSTYLGGADGDYGYDLTVDSNGDVHIVGETYSNNFPTSLGAVDTTLGGWMDGFYAILLANLTDLVMGTYIGGSDDDSAYSVATSGDQFGHVAGETYSMNFHTTAGAYQTAFKGDDMDAFFSKLSFDSIAPVADAGPDWAIDQHDTVDLDGTGSWDNIGVLNWTWSFDYGGETMTLYGDMVSFTFHEAGEYVVTLTVLDLASLWGQDTCNVTVRDITPPEANAGSTRAIDQHQTVVFNGLGSLDNVGVVNWTWSFIYDGEVVTLYGPDPDFVFDEAGEYNVTLMVIDAAGLSDVAWVTVIVKDIEAPSVDAGADQVIDQGQVANFNGGMSTDNVGIVNWTWSFVYKGAPWNLYGETASYTFDDAGTYTVTLHAEDALGNMGSDTLTVRVRDTTPPVANAGVDQEVIQGSTVSFDGTGSSDNVRLASYTWGFDYQGVPIEMTGNRPTYFFEAAGVYVITLTVTDLENNTHSDTMQVTVRDITSPVADAGDDMTVDQGDSVSFDGLGSADNVGVASWTWTFTYDGAEEELTGPSPTFVFANAGDYRVDLVVTDAAGNSGVDYLMVRVSDITAPVANAGADRTSDQGQAVTLDGSASSDNLGIDVYAWSFEYGGGTEELLGRMVQFPFDVPGDYTITLRVTDAAGNSADDSFDLHVRDTVRPTPPSMSDVEAGTGDKVTFDASGAIDNVGVVKWTWTFKEGGKTVTLDGEKASHTFDEAGDYKVTLTVEDAEGNQASTAFDVTVAGSSWLWIVIVIVIVVVVALALAMMRGRGGRPEEEAPVELEATDEIIIEERVAE